MSTVTARASQASRQVTSVGALAIAGVKAAIIGLVSVEVYAVVLRAAGVWLRAGVIGARAAHPVSYGSIAAAVLLGAFWGSIAAAVVARKARHPQRAFAVIAAAAVALSLVFPLAAGATPTGVKLALTSAHLLAAAVMVPAFLRQLAPARTDSFAELLARDDMKTTAAPVA
jgi:hypothetical protein